MSPSAIPTSQCVSVTLLLTCSPLTSISLNNYCTPQSCFYLSRLFFGDSFWEGCFFGSLGQKSSPFTGTVLNKTSATSKRNGNELVHMLQESLAHGLPELSNKCFMLREFCSSGRHSSITASPGNGALIACLSGTLGLSFQCIVKFSPQFFLTAIINDIWQISNHCLNKRVPSYHQDNWLTHLYVVYFMLCQGIHRRLHFLSKIIIFIFFLL